MAKCAKEKLKTGLYRRDPAIRVPDSDVYGLLGQVLSENPKLIVYLSSISYEQRASESVLHVEYCNTEVHVSEIVQLTGESELESVLHGAIGKFDRQKIVVVPSALDLSSSFSCFMTTYRGFYSNLIAIEPSIRTAPFFGKWRYVIFSFQYRIGRVKLSMMERAVREKLAEVGKKLFIPEMSAEVKAYLAHNYLARTVTYWNKEKANPLEESYMQSAYGALINGKCVCQGYAEAYKRILDAQGIVCEVICGKIRGAEEHHAWNIVGFGKEFYHVDVTWDSEGGGRKSNNYYCRSDADLSANRLWTRRSGMICNGRRDILQEVKREIAKNGARYVGKGIEREYLV